MTSIALSPFPLRTSTLARHDTPLGRLEIHVEGRIVTSLVLSTDGALPHDGEDELVTPVHDSVRRQLDEYFAGRRKAFDVPVAHAGTAFQRGVWAQLMSVPWGATTTYGAVGQALGRPTAGRAVGGAVAANPLPLIVPCHRVLAAGRRMTGYGQGDGLATKAWLLQHEGVPFS